MERLDMTAYSSENISSYVNEISRTTHEIRHVWDNFYRELPGAMRCAGFKHRHEMMEVFQQSYRKPFILVEESELSAQVARKIVMEEYKLTNPKGHQRNYVAILLTYVLKYSVQW